MTSARTRAFTLIELLVVVAIIALLIAILLPALGKAKEITYRTTCATQLKGQGTSFAIYAAQYNDRLPYGGDMMAPAGSTWLHDESTAFSDALLGTQTNNGMSPDSVRKWFYCPANPEYNMTQNWTASGTTGKRLLGYAYLNDRGLAGNYLPDNAKPSPRTNPPLTYHKKWSSEPNPSQAELVEDLILNTNDPATNGIYTTSTASTGTYVNSVSHFNGSRPAGSNVLCCDGHVEWRAWGGPGKIHWVAVGGGPSGSTNFILIDP